MRRPQFIARQGRRPTGILGAIVARLMALETKAANLVALDLLRLAMRDQVLELGCGHGATLRRAAEIVTDGFLAGIDHSDLMLRIARRRNRRHLAGGLIELTRADSEHIPYPAQRFNKVYAVHAIYFWSWPERHLGEIYRVLSPGGCLVLGYRPQEDERFARDFPASIYAIRSISEVEALLRDAGFDAVRTKTEPDESEGTAIAAWTVAQKPETRWIGPLPM